MNATEPTKNVKPLGHRSYGSIPHLPGSRRGPADYGVNEGQERIATTKARDKHDFVVVQEKLDGSNVGVAMKGGEILAVTRAGYLGTDSPYAMHHRFAAWVARPEQQDRFRAVLTEGERVCGEWLVQAHGTRYDLAHEPFVAFDIIRGQDRVPFAEFVRRMLDLFTIPMTLNAGPPVTVEAIVAKLADSGDRGWHGATEPVEGAVWRVERKGKVDFLCKYVRHGKVDGCYLDGDPVLNTWPGAPDGRFPWE